MTSGSIDQIMLFYIIALPFYLALAGYSLRYYVKKNANSLEQLIKFLSSLHFPSNLFFNVKRSYTFARIEAIKPEIYFFNTRMRDLLINRIVCVLLSSVFILALLISHLFYRVPVDPINFSALCIHLLTFLWAFRFGSHMR